MGNFLAKGIGSVVPTDSSLLPSDWPPHVRSGVFACLLLLFMFLPQICFRASGPTFDERQRQREFSAGKVKKNL